MTGLQKRHFEAAARIVREAPSVERRTIAAAFLALFAGAPRFDVERFWRACFGEAATPSRGDDGPGVVPWP